MSVFFFLVQQRCFVCSSNLIHICSGLRNDTFVQGRYAGVPFRPFGYGHVSVLISVTTDMSPTGRGLLAIRMAEASEELAKCDTHK